MINQVNKEGKVVAVFDNYNKAEIATGISGSSISKCCKGKRKTAGGFSWVQSDEEISKVQELNDKEYHDTYKTVDTNPFKSKDFVNAKSSDELRFDAYTDMTKKYSEYMAFVTWSTLLGIEVMALSYEGLIDDLKSDGIYRMGIKKTANEVMFELKKFIRRIHTECYSGDEVVVINEAQNISIDLFKLKLSISNYLYKFDADYNKSISSIKLCQCITDLIQSMHDNRKEELKKLNPNIDFSSFMKPTVLSSKINKLSCEIQSISKNKDQVIDLNDDNSIKIGARVLDNKINDCNFIANLINEIYKYDNNRGTRGCKN